MPFAKNAHLLESVIFFAIVSTLFPDLDGRFGFCFIPSPNAFNKVICAYHYGDEGDATDEELPPLINRRVMVYIEHFLIEEHRNDRTEDEAEDDAEGLVAFCHQ